MTSLTSRTRVLALLGDPVEHSLSPVIQNAAFREAGVDGVYVALRCDAADLVGFMHGLGRAGAGGNITLPHKEKAASFLDERSEAVRRTGACNTFWGDGGRVCGDNTDVEGFRRALRHFLGRAPKGFRVLLLGAGGAARATLVALLDEGVEDVLLLNRSTERARAVARRIGGERVRVAEAPRAVDDGIFDLVVNATRLGLTPGDKLPIDLSRLARVRCRDGSGIRPGRHPVRGVGRAPGDSSGGRWGDARAAGGRGLREVVGGPGPGGRDEACVGCVPDEPPAGMRPLAETGESPA